MEQATIWRGMRLLWAQVPHRNRAMIKANFLMWAQISWVNVLHLWYQISGTRRAAIGMGVGCVASTSGLFIYARRMWRRELERMAYEDALKAWREYLGYGKK